MQGEAARAVHQRLRSLCFKHLKPCHVAVATRDVPDNVGTVEVTLTVPRKLLQSLPLLRVRAAHPAVYGPAGIVVSAIRKNSPTILEYSINGTQL